MISNEMFYKLYSDAIIRRKIWEKDNLPQLMKHFDTLQNCKFEKIQKLKDAVYALEPYLSYNLNPVVEQSKEVIFSELKFLKEKYEFELINAASGFSSFEFVSRAIISESDPKTNSYFEADLGKFVTKIEFRARLDAEPKAITLTRAKSAPQSGSNNKGKEITGSSGYLCYHPHISIDSTLCVGTYGGGNDPPLFGDQKTLNITGMFNNFCALLCRYNANSLNFGGAYIDNWVGHKCSVCFEFAPTAVKCAKSGLMIHEDCAEKIDGKFYSLGQVKTCTSCGKITPNYIAYSIDKTICSECEGI